jgi:ring-1,2-phenylacetyl-CoA epoxidase subunit PaaE
MEDAQIKFELFAGNQPGRAPKRATAAAATEQTRRATVTLDGASRTIDLPADQTILQAALANNLEAPYACAAGVCSTCRRRVLEGEVEMAANHALEDYEIEKGYVLSCQAYALSDKVVVDYDQ